MGIPGIQGSQKEAAILWHLVEKNNFICKNKIDFIYKCILLQIFYL